MLRLSYFSKTNLGEVYEFKVTGRRSHHIKMRGIDLQFSEINVFPPPHFSRNHTFTLRIFLGLKHVCSTSF